MSGLAFFDTHNRFATVELDVYDSYSGILSRYLFNSIRLYLADDITGRETYSSNMPMDSCIYYFMTTFNFPLLVSLIPIPSKVNLFPLFMISSPKCSVTVATISTFSFSSTCKNWFWSTKQHIVHCCLFNILFDTRFCTDSI